MKLEDIQQAKMLDDRRRELAFKITLVRGNGLGVTIQGNYQDNEILDAVREHVVAVLESRIDGIDDELRAIGVDIEKEAASEEHAGFKEPKVPAPPRPRKSIGMAETVIGREPLQYAASDMEKNWLSGYRAGWDAAKPPPPAYSKAMEAEDDAWNESKANGGPRPARPVIRPPREKK